MPLTCFSQLSFNIGLTSSGRTAVMLTAGNFYVKSIQEAATFDAATGYAEQHEIVAGYILKVHESVSIIGGVGVYQNHFIVDNKYGSHVYDIGPYLHCCEIGFRYSIVRIERTSITITGLINNYSGVSTMIGIGYKILDK